MTKTEAINHFGGVRPLANALGLWVSAVYSWPERPPLLRQYQLEEITGGALKADRKGAFGSDSNYEAAAHDAAR